MRHELSQQYISGVGLEIAAFHNPWPIVNAGTQVIYLDKLTNAELTKTFPEVSHKPFVNIHVLDDANYLEHVLDESMDFVVSSHVLEHMENAGVALRNWLRVLKIHKHLVMAIPLKHNYIDKDRAPTSSRHLLDEFLSPLDYNLESHYREYFTDSVDKLTGDALENAIAVSVQTKANIHFHCWDEFSFGMFIGAFSRHLPYEVCTLKAVGEEVFVVLKKTGAV